MPKIKIETLEPGMTVSTDVKNIDNMLLIPAGCELTERQINILQAWGIEEIEVEAVQGVAAEVDPLERVPVEVLAQMTAELKGHFWKPDENNPLFQEIFKLMLRRRVLGGTSR